MTLDRAHRLDGELRREPEDTERDVGPGGERRGPGRRTQVDRIEQAGAVAQPPGAPREADAAAPGRRPRVEDAGAAGGGAQIGAQGPAAEREGVEIA